MIVVVILEHPGFDQTSPVSKRNAIKIVFNDRLSFGNRVPTGSRSGNGNLRRRGCGRLGGRLSWRLSLRSWSGWLRQIFLQHGLKQNDHQECERKNQEQSTLHAGILLRIGKFWQDRYSVTAQFVGGSALGALL